MGLTKNHYSRDQHYFNIELAKIQTWVVDLVIFKTFWLAKASKSW
jgi:hypothetical protein